MVAVIRLVFTYGPLIFAFGFLAPLIAQIITKAGWTMPGDVSPIWIGLAAAAVLGLTAQVRGCWI